MADTQITSIDQVKVGNFVKLVDRDKSGKFSYVGEVISVREETKLLPGMFEMLTFDGVMGFTFPHNKSEDPTHKKEELGNELYFVKTKPTGWAKFKKDPTVTKKEEPKIIPAKPKKEQVFDLVKANPRKKEAALLKLALKEIGGSQTQLKNYIKLALAKK